MSYASTIEAVSKVPGSPDSAFKNPALDGFSAITGDPEISAFFDLVNSHADSATQLANTTQQEYVTKVDAIATLGAGMASPSEVSAYDTAHTNWINHPTTAHFDTFKAASVPLYQSGSTLADPLKLQEVNDVTNSLASVTADVTAALQTKAEVDRLVTTLDVAQHGDSTAADDGSVEANIARVGIGGVVSQKLKSLPTDMAILSGGETAVQHIARVDGAAPLVTKLAEGGTSTCDPNSLIRKGLKALTDVANLLKDVATNALQAIKGVLGPIAEWTMDKLKSIGSAIRGVVGSIVGMVTSAISTFAQWVQEGMDALSLAFNTIKNKAFLYFMNSIDPCIKDALGGVINSDNIDNVALEKAKTVV